ncbi:MAG: hypothetical protein KDA80_23380 [Planctomycetaceae bacterium]|nr:hypothetical protein [Planctomycetaceae bacterium]
MGFEEDGNGERSRSLVGGIFSEVGLLVTSIVDLFSGRNRKVQPSDEIWMTDQAMWTGFSDALSHPDTRIRIVTAHFPDDLGGAVEAMQSRRIPFRVWIAPPSREAAMRDLQKMDNEILISDARTFPDWSQQPPFESAACRPVSVLVCHHHPLPAEDQRIIDFVTSLNPKSELQFYTSLEHPLFQRFMGDSVKELLQLLGMKEDESIHHPMVSRHLQRIQQRIARHNPDRQEADSCGEWFHLNLKDG